MPANAGSDYPQVLLETINKLKIDNGGAVRILTRGDRGLPKWETVKRGHAVQAWNWPKTERGGDKVGC